MFYKALNGEGRHPVARMEPSDLEEKFILVFRSSLEQTTITAGKQAVLSILKNCQVAGGTLALKRSDFLEIRPFRVNQTAKAAFCAWSYALPEPAFEDRHSSRYSALGANWLLPRIVQRLFLSRTALSPSGRSPSGEFRIS